MITTSVGPDAAPVASARTVRAQSTAHERFPARAVAVTWPATGHGRDQVWAQLTAAPFVLDAASTQYVRVRGLAGLLDWLEGRPGATWQERWLAGGVEAAGGNWAEVAIGWLHERGQRSQYLRTELANALVAVICADLIRPSLGWLVSSLAGKGALARGLARSRDPEAFARLQERCDTDEAVSEAARDEALRRVSLILAAKGGGVGDIIVGDVVELFTVEAAAGLSGSHAPVFYQLLHQLGVLGAQAPRRLQELRTPGQRSPEELIDRYRLVCRPVRDLLVDYLRERQPALDYTSLKILSHNLGKQFWQDLEHHHPGIDSLHLPREVADAWKQRQRTKPKTSTSPTGEKPVRAVPRVSYQAGLLAVRAFYLDLSQWAIEDPARWASWVVPCPVSHADVDLGKLVRHRKARMDARTRERLPVLPILVRTVDERRAAAAALLEAARRTPLGDTFTTNGQTLTRSLIKGKTGRIYVDDPATGRRRDLGLAEDHAFWAWAAVEVLRLTGIRIEELLEITHHSLIQYRLPTTGELIPLLQIVPSKTDQERLLVVSPELADVLSTIIRRIRQTSGAVPLVPAYDPYECTWQPPAPVLFQRRFTTENRSISLTRLRTVIDEALLHTGLVDPATGLPLRYTPHDFRRILITDTIMNGLPPHIAQIIAGHRNINTTMGYKAVYPHEAIQAHLAFLARRRSLRPSEEYRVPTDEEWTEFLGHFELRKVATGTCGRAFSTPCIHEHSCLRCSMHWPDPAQRPRIAEIHDNLIARIAEAEREGWRGEAEGLKISLTGARDKLAQIDRRPQPTGPVDVGMPAFT
ncbi:MAG TPA: site-specific integrase, partial [Kineosporiaceae bacterium]|nr:site-specific integrase [Kineosporiaceae bacterium]